MIIGAYDVGDLGHFYGLAGKTFLEFPGNLTSDATVCARTLHLPSFVTDSISPEEFSAVIEDTDGRHISFWESTYRGEKGTLLDARTLVVQERYERFHLRVNPENRQICDHLGIELSFIGYLFHMLNACSPNTRAAVADYAGDFLENHVRFLIEKVTPFNRDTYRRWLECLFEESEKHVTVLQALAVRAMSSDKEFSPDDQQDLKREQDLLIDAALRETRSLPVPDCFIRLEHRSQQGERVFHTSGRNNCGGRCAIDVHENRGMIVGLSPARGKVTGTHLCARGYGYRQTFLSPERLRYPLRRSGKRGQGKFERISWEEAVETIVGEWKRIRDEYGPQSRYVNYASGVSAMMRPNVLAQRLLALDGGYLDSYNSYSSACTSVATPYTYGNEFSGNSSHFFSQSQLIILWGHNPSESVFGSEFLKELMNARKNGIKIISIDPRCSDTTAALADQWIGIKPSTDSALMDAMAYVILSEGFEDRAFMDTFCIGFDERHMPEGTPCGESYETYVYGVKDGVPKTPEWAEGITGVPRATIVALAREYACSKPAALIQGLGPQRTCNGEQTARSSTLLACLTGNVGIPGGSAAGNGFIELKPMPFIRALPNPYKAKIPCFLWTDAIVRGEDMTAEHDMVRGVKRLKAPIKMILNLAGNTLVNQHSDVNRTIAILEDTSKCEFILASDVFMTPSASYADIVLPATSFFEDENITYPWREGDYFLYNSRVINPLFECRFEYDWLKEIAANLGVYEQFTEGHETIQDWLRDGYDTCRKVVSELPSFEEFCRDGGYQYKERTNYIAYEKQISNLKDNPFPTPSGKIEIFSARLYDMNNPAEVPAIPKYVEGFEGPSDPLAKKYPLQLIGWHTKRRCHSVHDNNAWMDVLESPSVWMNPHDARTRGIVDGQQVEVYNDRGRVRIEVRVTDRIIAGVVAISQGAWYTPNDHGVDIRGNINTLTTQRPTPLAKGNPQHTNLVEIKRVAV